MFQESGKRIKSMAIVLFIVQIILSIFISIAAGIFLMRLFDAIGVPGSFAWVIAIVFFVVSWIFWWIVYLFLYSYGEIVDSNKKTADYMAFVADRLKKGGIIPSNSVSSQVPDSVAGTASASSVSQRTETNYARPRPTSNSSDVTSLNARSSKGVWICEVCGFSNEGSSSCCYNCKRPKY